MANHEFHPQISQIEFDFATNRSRGMFVMALRKEVKNPFPPESDEVTVKDDPPRKTITPRTATKMPTKTRTKAKTKGEEGRGAKGRAIDFDGLEQRVARVPLDANNYFGLAVKTDALIYGVAPEFYYGRPAATKASLRIFTFKDRKETTLVDDIGGFVVSHDGSKVLVRQEQAWNVYDATAAGGSTKKTVSTAGLDAGERSGRGMEPDLQRSLAPLSRFLLRAQHAWLRLGSPAPALQPASALRRASHRPELRDR